MCGICGLVNYGKGKIEEDRLSSMCRLMQHRGPDDEGVYIDNRDSGPNIGLGHRRLKIIDLSEAGHQPMTNEDKSVWMVFNGEIYNFKELRDKLEKKGHIFHSHTDTECVVHLYEEYGEECVSYLRGMFAFAIWDKKNEILMLARDRVGKKPLLYSHKDRKFSFSSEFCSILASGYIDKGINFDAIDYYLSFGYIPGPLTIYKEIFKLPPAHILILKNDSIKIKQYWVLNYKDKIRISEQDAADEILKLLEEAVRIRLYSDVPLGAFLSGGIDSSAVVALMSRMFNGKVRTFSIGFQEADYNELKYARNIASRFNTEHSEFIVRPKALDILPLLVERYGEPYADSSCIPTYYVSEQTKKYVTVALNGDGGDELFAGYNRYPAMLLAEKIPPFAKNIIKNISSILPDSVNFKSRIRKAKRFLNGSVLSKELRYIKWAGIFDSKIKEVFYTQDFAKLTSKASPVDFIKPYLNEANGLSMLDALLLTDTMTYLPYDLLVKVDITSMANSLEARSPFLDHKLMEFVARLPAEYKMKNLCKKYILKKALKNYLPRENIYRKKMGFGVPVGEWFRGELKGFLSETILSKRFFKRGYFKPKAVNEMIKAHTEKKADYSFQLWAVLMLELWHQRFID